MTTLSERRDAYGTFRDALLDGFEDVIITTEEPAQVGVLRNKLQYQSEYEYGPFTVTLSGDPGEVVVKSVQFTPTEDTSLSLSRRSLPEDVLFGTETARLTQAYESFSDLATELGAADDALQTLDDVTPHLVEMCDSVEFQLDEIITEFDDRNASAIERMFDVEDVRNHPELENLVNRDGGDLRVHYQDGTLAVVSFWYERHGTVRDHSGFVIGRDDTPTGLFVHEVDDTNLVAGHETTRQATRRAMGFTIDLDVDDPEDPIQLHTSTRVQGDLRFTLVREFDTPRDALSMTSASEAIRSQLNRTYGPELTTRLLNTARIYEEEGTIFTHIYESYPSETDAAFAGAFPSLDVNGIAQVNRRMGEVLTELCASVLDHPSLMDADTNRAKESGWLNLPVDNHLLRFETAWVSPLSEADTEPVLVVVPQESVVSITHNEHPEKRVALNPGLYEVSVLPRGPTPDGFTPPSW